MRGGRWERLGVNTIDRFTGTRCIDDFAYWGLITNKENLVTLANQSGRNGLHDQSTIGNHIRNRSVFPDELLVFSHEANTPISISKARDSIPGELLSRGPATFNITGFISFNQTAISAAAP